MKTSPGSVGHEHIQDIDEGHEDVPGHIVHVNVLVVVEEAPVDDGAEGGDVAVDVGEDPEQSVGQGQAGLAAVGGAEVQLLPLTPLPPVAGRDQAGLSGEVEEGEDPGPVGEVEDVLPAGRQGDSQAQGVEEEGGGGEGDQPPVQQIPGAYLSPPSNPLEITR